MINVIKTTKIESKSKHFNSETHIHKKNGAVVKVYDFIRPESDEVIYILKVTIKDCSNKSFISIEFRCVYDKKYKNIENNEEDVPSITHGYMKYIFQFYGFNKKIKTASKMD